MRCMNTFVNMGNRWASEFLEEIQENIQMASLYHNRFTCARSGKSRRKEDPIIERINSAPKTQSPAQMTARFRPDGLYYITEVVLEHNHEMMTSSNTRFLRCNRKVVAHGKEVHEDNQKSGVSHKKSCQPRVPDP